MKTTNGKFKAKQVSPGTFEINTDDKDIITAIARVYVDERNIKKHSITEDEAENHAEIMTDALNTHQKHGQLASDLKKENEELRKALNLITEICRKEGKVKTELSKFEVSRVGYASAIALQQTWYRDHKIEPGELGYQYTHKDYDGPGDNRHGDCRTIEECKDEIDEKYWDEKH